MLCIPVFLFDTHTKLRVFLESVPTSQQDSHYRNLVLFKAACEAADVVRAGHSRLTWTWAVRHYRTIVAWIPKDNLPNLTLRLLTAVFCQDTLSRALDRSKAQAALEDHKSAAVPWPAGEPSGWDIERSTRLQHIPSSIHCNEDQQDWSENFLRCFFNEGSLALVQDDETQTRFRHFWNGLRSLWSG